MTLSDHLKPSINEIVQQIETCPDGYQQTVRELFSEMTQLQAIYAAASVSEILANSLGGAGRLARVIKPDDVVFLQTNARELLYVMDKQGCAACLQRLSIHPKFEAIALVSIVANMREAFAAAIVGQCVLTSEKHEQLDEVV